MKLAGMPGVAQVYIITYKYSRPSPALGIISLFWVKSILSDKQKTCLLMTDFSSPTPPPIIIKYPPLAKAFVKTARTPQNFFIISSPTILQPGLSLNCHLTAKWSNSFYWSKLFFFNECIFDFFIKDTNLATASLLLLRPLCWLSARILNLYQSR